MMSLGHVTPDQPIELNLDRLIGSHALAIANSGGGKSGLLRRMLETTAGRVQQIVLDIEDELYTLRERHSYVIAGGDGADMPATIAGARALALGALEHGFSLIVQLNDFGDRAPAFVAEFLGGLMNAPRDLWHPALVVIDELQRFAPNGEATEATPAVKDLVQRGRKRGFTMIGASLSMVEVNPRVRGLVNNWLLGRAGQELDRTAMAKQLGFSAKEGRDRLHGLAPRSFWGLGPAIADEPVLFRVADVETTPVRPGQAKIPTPPAPEALREILQGLAPPAEPESQISGYPDDTIPADPGEAFAKGQVIGSMLIDRDAEIDRLRAIVADQVAELEHLRGVDAECDRYQTGLGQLEELLVAIRSGTATKLHPQNATSGSTPARQQPSSSVEDASALGNGAPGESVGASTDREFRSLAVLAAIAPAGLSEAAWAQRAGRARKGGAWIRQRKRYADAGLIEQRDGRWFATPAGVEAAGAEIPDMPEPGLALVKWWSSRLGAPGRILELLAAVHPRALTREAIAAEVRMSAKGGAFARYVSELKKAELIDERGKRMTIAAGLLGDG